MRLSVREERSSVSRISGYVYNDYGQATEEIELLITGSFEFAEGAGAN